MSLADVAKELGFSNDQRLHSALNAQDVKSGLLESIASVLGKDVSWFYDEMQKTNSSVDTSGAYVGRDNNGNITTISERFIGLLEKKDEQIDKLLELLKTK